MLTPDRLGGSALWLLAVFVMWESRELPLGTWHNPGPGYFPVLLAVILLVLGSLVCVMGGRAAPIATVGWGEARQALVIPVCLRVHLPGSRAPRLSPGRATVQVEAGNFILEPARAPVRRG
jgi:hypothetical protein